MNSIDLGLSVDWGNTNLGTDNSYEYGIYLSWSSNSEDDIKGMPLEEHQIDCISGDENFDPCTKQLGKGWRLPTKEEFNELINNCVNERIKLKGVNGILFTSNINGEKLFFPAGGCKSSLFSGEMKDYSVGSELYYWSADFYNEHTNNKEFLSAYALQSAGGIACKPSIYNWTVRSLIRPVKDKEKEL